MGEERPLIPYAVQKGNRPKIEVVLENCLHGELQGAALDFAAYMQERKMPFRLYSSSTRTQRAVYKGAPICNIIVYNEEDWRHVDRHQPGDAPYWTLAPNLVHMSAYEDVIRDEGLQLDFNGVIYYCVHGSHKDRKGACGPDKPCAGGRDMRVFGSEYHGVCRWIWPSIRNPNGKTVAVIKRLLALECMTRESNN